jgi:branched-chain amino acid transport system substrate-binding protein
VEGLRTGIADRDEDGWISIDELHEFAQEKVREVAPAMQPKIYAVEQGYKIRFAKAPVGDPIMKNTTAISPPPSPVKSLNNSPDIF